VTLKGNLTLATQVDAKVVAASGVAFTISKHVVGVGLDDLALQVARGSVPATVSGKIPRPA